ncbi:hypothetical protein NKDENANG_00145 [Candidatus Entotheonellaceae bacterium PAL068K]
MGIVATLPSCVAIIRPATTERESSRVHRHSKYLFTPCGVGSMTVRNRIVVPGHATRFMPPDGLPTERMLHYGLAKARQELGTDYHARVQRAAAPQVHSPRRFSATRPFRHTAPWSMLCMPKGQIPRATQVSRGRLPLTAGRSFHGRRFGASTALVKALVVDTGRPRQVRHALPGGPVNGLGDRGWWGHDGPLTNSTHAVGMAWIGDLHQDSVDHR